MPNLRAPPRSIARPGQRRGRSSARRCFLAIGSASPARRRRRLWLNNSLRWGRSRRPSRWKWLPCTSLPRSSASTSEVDKAFQYADPMSAAPVDSISQQADHADGDGSWIDVNRHGGHSSTTAVDMAALVPDCLRRAAASDGLRQPTRLTWQDRHPGRYGPSPGEPGCCEGRGR